MDSAGEPDQEYVYIRFTYFSTNLVYPFTLRVTGIKSPDFIENSKVPVLNLLF